MPQGGKVVDKVEGADAAAVTRMVQTHCPQLEASSQKAGSIAAPAAFSNGAALHAQAVNGSQSLEQRVDQLINKQPIMLFMKVLFFSSAHLAVPRSSSTCNRQAMIADDVRDPQILTAMHADRPPQAGHPVLLGHACIGKSAVCDSNGLTTLALPFVGDTGCSALRLQQEGCGCAAVCQGAIRHFRHTDG